MYLTGGAEAHERARQSRRPFHDKLGFHDESGTYAGTQATPGCNWL
jgi:hypothetical protein